MSKLKSIGVLSAILLFALASIFMPAFTLDVAAQDNAPGVDTPTAEPPTPTPEPTTPPTEEPTPTTPPTEEPTPGTSEPTPIPPTPTPEPPQEIPEPITVVLFGTGLAALSAAVARRKREE